MASKKRKAAKTGAKAGKRKAARSPAGTAVFTVKALAGNEQARSEMHDAYESARKAYRRSSDRRGRPDLVALLEDRKAKREAGNAVTSLRRALRIADKRRHKPRSVKAPAAVVAVVVASAGAAALIYRQRSSNGATQGEPAPVTAA